MSVAPWECRACGVFCCEHFCGLKTATGGTGGRYEATCGACRTLANPAPQVVLPCRRWVAGNPAHPTLRRPVHPANFIGTVKALLVRAGLRAGLPPRLVRVEFTEALARAHSRSARRYAQVGVGPDGAYVFEFAPAALWLPRAHRRGLIAHEIGHLIAWRGEGAPHSERDADEAARQLGISVRYDLRWPGKGLQREGRA